MVAVPIAISESQNLMGKKIINELYYSHEKI
jgi:hypothetical protein